MEEGQGGFYEHICHRLDFLHALHHLLGALEKKLLCHFLGRRLYLVAQLLHLILLTGISRKLPGSGQAAKGNALDLPIKLLVGLAGCNSLHGSGFFFQQFRIHLGAVRLHADFLAEAHLQRPLACDALQVRNQGLGQIQGLKFLYALDMVRRPASLQPFLHPGIAHGKFK